MKAWEAQIHSETVSASLVKMVFYGIVDMGIISPNELAKMSDLTIEEMEDLDGRIPVAKKMNLWKIASQFSKNPAFALHLGEKTTLEDIGILGHIIKSSTTLMSGLHQAIRLSRLLNDTCRWGYKKNGDALTIELVVKEKAYDSTHEIEMSLASFLSLFRSILPKQILPLEVRFQYAIPEYIDEYNRLFNCELHFNQPDNVMVFKIKIFEAHIADGNDYINNIILKHAESLIANLESKSELQWHVKQSILNKLPLGQANILNIASDLFMSRRTLHRKLREENLSFKYLLDSVRKEQAHTYLQNQQYSISEVAYLLGFSEPSVFYKAFKRWFRTTPGKFRYDTNSRILVSPVGTENG